MRVGNSEVRRGLDGGCVERREESWRVDGEDKWIGKQDSEWLHSRCGRCGGREKASLLEGVVESLEGLAVRELSKMSVVHNKHMSSVTM